MENRFFYYYIITQKNNLMVIIGFQLFMHGKYSLAVSVHKQAVERLYFVTA